MESSATQIQQPAKKQLNLRVPSPRLVQLPGGNNTTTIQSNDTPTPIRVLNSFIQKSKEVGLFDGNTALGLTQEQDGLENGNPFAETFKRAIISTTDNQEDIITTQSPLGNQQVPSRETTTNNNFTHHHLHHTDTNSNLLAADEVNDLRLAPRPILAIVPPSPQDPSSSKQPQISTANVPDEQQTRDRILSPINTHSTDNHHHQQQQQQHHLSAATNLQGQISQDSAEITTNHNNTKQIGAGEENLATTASLLKQRASNLPAIRLADCAHQSPSAAASVSNGNDRGQCVNNELTDDHANCRTAATTTTAAAAAAYYVATAAEQQLLSPMIQSNGTPNSSRLSRFSENIIPINLGSPSIFSPLQSPLILSPGTPLLQTRDLYKIINPNGHNLFGSPSCNSGTASQRSGTDSLFDSLSSSSCSVSSISAAPKGSCFQPQHQHQQQHHHSVQHQQQLMSDCLYLQPAGANQQSASSDYTPGMTTSLTTTTSAATTTTSTAAATTTTTINQNHLASSNNSTILGNNYTTIYNRCPQHQSQPTAMVANQMEVVAAGSKHSHHHHQHQYPILSDAEYAQVIFRQQTALYNGLMQQYQQSNHHLRYTTGPPAQVSVAPHPPTSMTGGVSSCSSQHNSQKSVAPQSTQSNNYNNNNNISLSPASSAISPVSTSGVECCRMSDSVTSSSSSSLHNSNSNIPGSIMTQSVSSSSLSIPPPLPTAQIPSSNTASAASITSATISDLAVANSDKLNHHHHDQQSLSSRYHMTTLPSNSLDDASSILSGDNLANHLHQSASASASSSSSSSSSSLIGINHNVALNRPQLYRSVPLPPNSILSTIDNNTYHNGTGNSHSNQRHLMQGAHQNNGSNGIISDMFRSPGEEIGTEQSESHYNLCRLPEGGSVQAGQRKSTKTPSNQMLVNNHLDQDSDYNHAKVLEILEHQQQQIEMLQQQQQQQHHQSKKQNISSYNSTTTVSNLTSLAPTKLDSTVNDEAVAVNSNHPCLRATVDQDTLITNGATFGQSSQQTINKTNTTDDRVGGASSSDDSAVSIYTGMRSVKNKSNTTNEFTDERETLIMKARNAAIRSVRQSKKVTMANQKAARSSTSSAATKEVSTPVTGTEVLANKNKSTSIDQTKNKSKDTNCDINRSTIMKTNNSNDGTRAETEIKPKKRPGGRRRRNVTMEELQARKNRSKERNRVAAKRCRQKRKVFIDELRKRMDHLDQLNQRLQKENMDLRRELEVLRSRLN